MRFSVPKYQIERIMGNVHVGTSDADVATEIRVRIRRAPVVLTAAQEKACVAYALKCHRANQKLYHSVMTGRF